MKQAINTILFLLATLVARADLPGQAYQYDLYSQNSNFYFKSIPFYNYDQTNFGKTIVYDTKTKRKLYQVDNYLPQEAFLNNNGRSLITSRYWMWGHDKFEVGDYDSCKYHILIYGAIDRQGNCKIFMLDTSVDKKENKEWNKLVADWVTKQAYKTQLIPINCDKWVFQEYFYLK